MTEDARTAALFRAESLFAEHVCDAAVLAGFDVSTDDVRRILARDPLAPATPAAHTFVRRQGEAFGWILRRVRAGTFEPDWDAARAVNGLVTGGAVAEAADEAPAASGGKGGAITGWLRAPGRWRGGEAHAGDADESEGPLTPPCDDPVEEAARVFLTLATRRPFARGNVRTGYLLAEGTVLRAGLPAIGVPGPLRHEYDDLVRRCRTGDGDGAHAEALAAFFRRCGRWP